MHPKHLLSNYKFLLGAFYLPRSGGCCGSYVIVNYLIKVGAGFFSSCFVSVLLVMVVVVMFW